MSISIFFALGNVSLYFHNFIGFFFNWEENSVWYHFFSHRIPRKKFCRFYFFFSPTKIFPYFSPCCLNIFINILSPFVFVILFYNHFFLFRIYVADKSVLLWNYYIIRYKVFGRGGGWHGYFTLNSAVMDIVKDVITICECTLDSTSVNIR